MVGAFKGGQLRRECFMLCCVMLWLCPSAEYHMPMKSHSRGADLLFLND